MVSDTIRSPDRPGEKTNEKSLEISENIMMECIKSRRQLSLSCVFAGIIALVLGFIVILFGKNPENQQIIKFMGIEVTATGAGAVVMATSVLWGFFAYKLRPQPYLDNHKRK